MLAKGERLRFAYLIGLALSILFTFGAYELVARHVLTGAAAILALLAFAFAQFFVQLVFFLHTGPHLASRARLIAVFSAFAVVLILVLGSIWIMQNLNNRTMSPQAQEEYMARQPGI